MLSKKVWQDPRYFIAFGFGAGLLPYAPGTWGTLAAIPIYFLLQGLPVSLYLTLTLLAFFLGVWITDKITCELGIEDCPGIVWDEVVGYLLAMSMAPVGLSWIIIGFVLFRLFDIWKPLPIRLLDRRLKGGWGIMLDDVLAGIYACLVMYILKFFGN